jgi:hypothetical protein
MSVPATQLIVVCPFPLGTTMGLGVTWGLFLVLSQLTVAVIGSGMIKLLRSLAG